MCLFKSQVDTYKWDTVVKGVYQLKAQTKALQLQSANTSAELGRLEASFNGKLSASFVQIPVSESINFKVVQYLEDRWLAWQNILIDIIPFKRDPKH